MPALLLPPPPSPAAPFDDDVVDELSNDFDARLRKTLFIDETLKNEINLFLWVLLLFFQLIKLNYAWYIVLIANILV